MASVGPLVAPADPGEQVVVPRIEGLAPEPDGTVNPAAARLGPAPVPDSPISPPANGSGASCASPIPLNASDPERPGTNASQSQTRPSGPNPESDRDVIVWLHQRMMTLQQERETRWQKILKLLPGLS
jgi:hypothetical protein